MLEAMRAIGFKIYGGDASGIFLLPGVWRKGRRSATAAEHAGGAIGRWDSVGLGRNGARETGQTYWFGRHHRRSNGKWPATRGGGETHWTSSRWRLQWMGPTRY